MIEWIAIGVLAVLVFCLLLSGYWVSNALESQGRLLDLLVDWQRTHREEHRLMNGREVAHMEVWHGAEGQAARAGVASLKIPQTTPDRGRVVFQGKEVMSWPLDPPETSS